jgi:hypothetical protein
MQAKPTLFDTAEYFQRQADRTRREDRKAHYQRCADQYRAEAKAAELNQSERQPIINGKAMTRPTRERAEFRGAGLGACPATPRR